MHSPRHFTGGAAASRAPHVEGGLARIAAEEAPVERDVEMAVDDDHDPAPGERRDEVRGRPSIRQARDADQNRRFSSHSSAASASRNGSFIAAVSW